MGALRLVVPTALLLWFLWRARVNRLFLLGVPLLMMMGQSIFFTSMRPFWTPARFEPQHHIMGWLFVVWLVLLVTTPKHGERHAGLFGPGRLLPEEVPLLFVGVLIVAHAAVAAAPAADIAGAVAAAADLGYLILGYLMVRGIASRFPRRQVIEFLTVAVLANTVAAALYVLHQGFGLPIYDEGEYFRTTYAGVEITRTFTFMPQLNLLALGFILARQRWTPGWLAVLAVTVLSILVSYTRTLLITVVVAIVLAVVVREVRRPDPSRFFRRVTLVTLSVLLVAGAFFVLLPAQSQFLVSRMSEFASAGGVSDIGNWHVREFKYTSVEDVVVRNDPLFGMGFPEPASNPVDAKIYRYSSDMAWIPILYRTGYVGIALFALLLLGFGARSLLLTLGGVEERRYLGLTYLVTVALMTLVCFTSWVFMQPQIAPMGLWVLALIAAETLRPDVDEAEATEAATAGAAAHGAVGQTP